MLNAALAITGAFRASSKELSYQEPGFEYLSSRKWIRKLGLFYKIAAKKPPNYILKYVSIRNSEKFPHMSCRRECFPNSYFPYVTKE